MTDCRFWGGYLLGIVTVLALNLFDSFSPTWRIGALAVAALAGFGLLLARFLGGSMQANGGRDGLEAGVPPASAPHLHDRPPTSDSAAGGARPEDPPRATARSAVRTESKPPSSFSPVSETAAEHEHPDSSSDYPSPDSASGLELSPPAPAASTSAAPQLATPGPEDLIDVWQQYWRAGDGHFKASGFESQLTASGFTARVIDGAEVGAGDHVLIVDPQCADQHFYVLPSFATSPRSVQRWFDDRSGGALTATTRRVITVAFGRWTNSGNFEVVKKGAVSE